MASVVWIPAFAGMTEIKTYPCKPVEGGRDLPLAIHTWFRAAILASTIWIPAFAGMTEIKTYLCKPVEGEGIY